MTVTISKKRLWCRGFVVNFPKSFLEHLFKIKPLRDSFWCHFFQGSEGVDGPFKKYVQVQELVYWRTLLSAAGNNYLEALPQKKYLSSLGW